MHVSSRKSPKRSRSPKRQLLSDYPFLKAALATGLITSVTGILAATAINRYFTTSDSKLIALSENITPGKEDDFINEFKKQFGDSNGILPYSTELKSNNDYILFKYPEWESKLHHIRNPQHLHMLKNVIRIMKHRSPEGFYISNKLGNKLYSELKPWGVPEWLYHRQFPNPFRIWTCT